MAQFWFCNLTKPKRIWGGNIMPARLNKTPGKKIKLRLLRAWFRTPFQTPTPSSRARTDIPKALGNIQVPRVVGACCRLADKENSPSVSLPPVCQGGKGAIWNRIGKRFVPDIANWALASYCVQLLDYREAEPFVMTLHWLQLSGITAAVVVYEAVQLQRQLRR